MGNISQDDRDKARADWMKAHPGEKPDEKAINGQVYQNFYDKAFNATGLGTGGAVQQAIQAATAAVQGLAGGDVAAALANGAAPYLAEVIGHRMGIDNNPQAKAIAHAIVGAALAAAQGQNAAAGATGAALGEITAGILKDQLYGKDTPVSDLTETQKQTLSALATLSSGLAGGLVADSTGSAVYAAQAGKTTAENNYLSFDEAREMDKAITKCRSEGSDCQPVIDHYAKLNKENSDKYKSDCNSNSLNCTAGYERLKLNGGTSAAERPTWLYGSLDNEDVRNAVLYENNKDLEYGMSHSDNWDRFGAFVAEPENMFGLLAGGRSLLSPNISTGAKLMGSGLSMSANAGIQILNGNTGDKFDYLNFFTSGVTGWGGTGKSLQTNMGLNVGGAYFTSNVTGQNSEAAMVGAGFGTMIGYGLGSTITSRMEAAEIKNHFGMSASKKAFEYSDKARYSNFITEGTKFSPLPGIIGGGFGSFGLEYSNSVVNSNILENKKPIEGSKKTDKGEDK